jgi:peptidoglycan hydrolase-like protein with peptidoglycan-binding domain
MYDFHRSRGKSIGDSDTQISFLLWEMQHDFPNQWKLITSSHDLADCSWQLLDKWENPDEKKKQKLIREKSAKDFYDLFANLNFEEAHAMTKQEAVELVLNQARAEVGYHEKASNSMLDDKTANSGSSDWNKYARDLDRLKNFYNGGKNGYSWCDIWCDWLFVKCFGSEIGRQMLCQPLNSAGAGCKFSVQYYKQYGRWITGTPEPGDQIFFTYAPGEYSHTGIVESISGGVVNTIEGNVSDSVGRRSYAVGSSNIAGYGRPRWELASGSSADAVVFPDSGSGGERILKIGKIGEDVRKIQEDLMKLGYDVGPDGADGEYGDNTMLAVMKFQRDKGLTPVDGEVGDDTRKALREALGETKPNENPKPVEKPESPKTDNSIPYQSIRVREIKMEDDGPDVKLAQAALQCWGYTIVVTGIFGKEMDEKIRNFQKAKGLDPDGEIGPLTWKALLCV